jgi:hypothetical protein
MPFDSACSTSGKELVFAARDGRAIEKKVAISNPTSKKLITKRLRSGFWKG